MKQGTNFILPIKIGTPIDTIESIEFVFAQDVTRLIFDYPSARAVLNDEYENTINLIWSREETYAFKTGKELLMDTRIKLKDSPFNPETPIVRLQMNPTLFKPIEND